MQKRADGTVLLATLHGFDSPTRIFLHKHSCPNPEPLSYRQDPGTVYMSISSSSSHVRIISVKFPSAEAICMCNVRSTKNGIQLSAYE